MEAVKSHFEAEAKEFDQIILTLIPYYHEMLDGLVLAIPYERSQEFSVIDLGCGTGTISKKVKERFANAKITCLDLAVNMIEMAKLKLSDYSSIRYQSGDFRSYEFDQTYDVAVSSLALHHLVTNKEKIQFYKQIYNGLKPGGLFLNADVVLGSNSHLQAVYMHKWKSFMKKAVSEDEIENNWIPKYQEEDRPAELMDHLAWLSEIGFNEVDVVWKYYNFCVYYGRK